MDAGCSIQNRMWGVVIGCFALGITALSFPAARAASDEIQVYTDDIRAPHEAGVELHLNFVPSGRKTPDYPGETPPRHTFHATPEFSIGLRPNWDAGFYLPTEVAPGGEANINGARARIKYLAPVEKTQPYFYGANVEVGYQSLRVSEDRYAAELRGIMGYRSGPWLLALNPILGWALSGPDRSGTPDLDLNFKAGREINSEWMVGIEHYAGFGPINKMANSSQQDHVFYVAADYEHKGFGLNFGIGKGLTNASDDWVVKAIVGFPLN